METVGPVDHHLNSAYAHRCEIFKNAYFNKDGELYDITL